MVDSQWELNCETDAHSWQSDTASEKKIDSIELFNSYSNEYPYKQRVRVFFFSACNSDILFKHLKSWHFNVEQCITISWQLVEHALKLNIQKLVALSDLFNLMRILSFIIECSVRIMTFLTIKRWHAFSCSFIIIFSVLVFFYLLRLWIDEVFSQNKTQHLHFIHFIWLSRISLS